MECDACRLLEHKLLCGGQSAFVLEDIQLPFIIAYSGYQLQQCSVHHIGTFNQAIMYKRGKNR